MVFRVVWWLTLLPQNKMFLGSNPSSTGGLSMWSLHVWPPSTRGHRNLDYFSPRIRVWDGMTTSRPVDKTIRESLRANSKQRGSFGEIRQSRDRWESQQWPVLLLKFEVSRFHIQTLPSLVIVCEKSLQPNR